MEKEYLNNNPQEDRDIFQNSPSSRVGGQVNKSFTQYEHGSPMLSLSNTYSKEEVSDFIQRAESLLGSDNLEWVSELKYDGVAVSLNYRNGKLYRALTRGNGLVGDDITDNIRTIRTIPLELRGEGYPDDFHIRGEVVFPHSAFEKHNQERIERGEEPFANPRNAASGSMKLLDSKETAKRGLDCYFYYILFDETQAGSLSELTHYERLNKAREWGFNISTYSAICSGIEDIMEFIDYWDKERHSIGVDTDGIVLKLNNTNLWERLGSTAKSPRWASAYKFKAEREKTKLVSIEYNVGRTGVVTPVAIFEKVWIDGSWVRRASLHNSDFISSMDIRLNDEVYVEKGGDIIPKVVGVDKDSRSPDSVELEYIKECPECHTPLIREEGEAGHYCPNYNHCPPQILGRFLHFISKKAMDIDGLGEERMKYLIDSGLVKDFSDLYNLQEEDLIGLGNLKTTIQEKGASNIITSIQNSKEISFERVLFALGIRFVGEVVAKRLARHYKNIDSIINTNYLELVEVDDIGDKIALSIVDYFSKQENLDLINKLKEIGLSFESKDESLGNSLEGLSLVVSGRFNHFSREGIKKAIEDNSGRVVSSISSKVDYLVAGERMGPAKRAQAEKLGVRIISEEEFISMIES